MMATLHTKNMDTTQGNQYHLIGSSDDDNFKAETEGMTVTPVTVTTTRNTIPWYLRVLVGVLGTVGGLFLVYMGIGGALMSCMMTDNPNADNDTLVRAIGGMIFFGFSLVLLGIALLIRSCRYAFGRNGNMKNSLGALLVDLGLAMALYVVIDWVSAITLDKIVPVSELSVFLVRWLPSGYVALRGLFMCCDCLSPNDKVDENDEPTSTAIQIPAIAPVGV